MRNRLLTGALGALLLGAGGIGAATAAQAEPVAEAPMAAAAEGDPQCGPNNVAGYLVPDAPYPGVDFHGACVAHDECYGSERSRYDCDVAFRNDMAGACAAAGAPVECYGVAEIYYQAVRNAAGDFYTGSGDPS